jgi:hypothetical protein
MTQNGKSKAKSKECQWKGQTFESTLEEYYIPGT